MLMNLLSYIVCPNIVIQFDFYRNTFSMLTLYLGKINTYYGYLVTLQKPQPCHTFPPSEQQNRDNTWRS